MCSSISRRRGIPRIRSGACITVVLLLTAFAGVGCTDGVESRTTTKSQKKSKPQGLKPNTTDDIGEFKAEEGKQVVDSKIKYTNPITGPLEAYDPMKQKISEIAITQSVELFRATEGRYPKDYDEFMTKVIKQNGVRLPELGVGKRYEYDVANHTLMVVTDAPK